MHEDFGTQRPGGGSESLGQLLVFPHDGQPLGSPIQNGISCCHGAYGLLVRHQAKDQTVGFWGGSTSAAEGNYQGQTQLLVYGERRQRGLLTQMSDDSHDVWVNAHLPGPLASPVGVLVVVQGYQFYKISSHPASLVALPEGQFRAAQGLVARISMQPLEGGHHPHLYLGLDRGPGAAPACTQQHEDEQRGRERLTP